jgi:hypothetical protein
MDYDLRTLAYVAELLHPPKQHSSQDLQKVHSLAFADPKCVYQNFHLIPGGASFFNPPSQPTMVSAAHFLPDRVQIREEMTGISREEFQDRIERVAAYSLEHLGIEQFALQNFVVRSLVNSRVYPDSKEFLRKSVLNMEDEDFQVLEREPQIVGLRFFFPQTNETRGAFNIRVESYVQEPRSVFVENIGIFRSLVTGLNLNELTSNFFATYDYLDSNIVDFIAQFDSKEAPPNEGG